MGRGDRTEIVRPAVVAHLESELTAALRRRSTSEARLGGALRALAPWSPALRNLLAESAGVLLRRASLDREIYACAIRSLADVGDKRAASLLKAALATEDGGGFASLSAACFVRDAGLAAPLAKMAASRHAHLAFAAEVARMARGESAGAHLLALAPKIKEAHRISLCLEMFVPLTRGPALPAAIGPPLAVLRDSERHLGRWLVLAEVAARAGDKGPGIEARAKCEEGPASSRTAWSLVAWALSPDAPPPSARPTLELVARLSDRPSSDRDTTFLFRLAAAKVPAVRPVLEGLVKGPLTTGVGVRSAMHLSRDHGKVDLVRAIEEAADSKHEDARGVAAAALWDAGDREAAGRRAESLCESQAISSLSWGLMVTAAREGKLGDQPVVSELAFRRIQSGWIE